MAELFRLETLLALATLTTLELVLGIDNIIVLAITVDRLPPAQQQRARTVGLAVALATRLGLLFALSAVTRLTAPLVTLFGHALSGRDLVLLAGGTFLVGKSTHELYQTLENPPAVATQGAAPVLATTAAPRSGRTFALVIAQIVALDIVFSLDSVIAAVGMARRVEVMAAAVVIAAMLMLVSARAIGAFVARHPSTKVLALSFLLLVGVLLVADGMGQHVNKGYVYFAMAFSFVVEMVNLRARGRRDSAALALVAERASGPAAAE